MLAKSNDVGGSPEEGRQLAPSARRRGWRTSHSGTELERERRRVIQLKLLLGDACSSRCCSRATGTAPRMRDGCWKDPWAATLRRCGPARSETYKTLVNFQSHCAKGRYGTEAPRDSWSVVMQQQAGDGGRLALRVVGLGAGDSANQDAEPELRSSGNTQWKRLLQLHTRGMARQGR